MVKRTIVIPDIHGCIKTLLSLLERLALSKFDALYLLGDYIDRGPASKEVIETILGMQAKGYQILPIRGNHEEMLLQALKTDTVKDFLVWVENGGLATLKSYGVNSIRRIPKGHITFLERLPLYRMTATHIFVHAGLDVTLDEPLSKAGEEAMLWTRQTLESTATTGGRQIVTGHTPVKLDLIRKSLANPHVRLDNGCVFGNPGFGNLLALVLETGELLVEKNSDTPHP